MESKIGFICKSIYVIIIPNRFIYLFTCLFNILSKEYFLVIKKVVVIRFSHRTQCLITTSVDITFINLITEYYM